MSPAEYVRAIEAHVCQKNDGHLIRVVGPAFEVVCAWERQGIPLKVALRGIDRYFERYYRNGPKRRPVRVEFCDTDVLETFDEWRRAVGVAARAGAHETANGDYGHARGPSLPAHLERVLIKLSSARASGRLDAAADAILDRVSAELDRAKAAAGGVRGDARKALVERLAAVDRELIDAVTGALAPAERDALQLEAAGELSGYRERMAPDAYADAVTRTAHRLVRERFGLPVVAFD